MAQITITDDTEIYFDAIKDEGVYSWNQGGKGITVSTDVRDAMELLHEVGAGATISVSRDANERLTGISIVNSGSSQILELLQEAFDDAITSHDELKEEDGYLP